MSAELRVDTAALASKGQRLADVANQIPDAPPAFAAASGDPLSAAGLAHQQAVEAALIEALPLIKRGAVDSAEKIVRAAHIYAATDSRLAGRVQQHGVDQRGGPGHAPGMLV